MTRTSLLFAGTAILCLFFADFEILTLNPWQELRRMAQGVLTPDFLAVYEIKVAFLNTITFAFCGIFLAILSGSILAFCFEFRPVRLFCAFIRAIHEIFWAIIFLPVVGLNSTCGILAIAIPYAGIFAKVFAEIRQESDQLPLKGLPPHSHPISKFFFGVFPVIYADLKHYSSYRLECGLRSSAILGFIGLPTLGFHLETAFREGTYSQAAAILFCFYLLIASLKYWVKEKAVLFYVVLSFIVISKEITFSWNNIIRFFTYEILPWPMRRAGVSDGSYSLEFAPGQVWAWIETVMMEEGFPGLWNTLILTQIVLVGTGVLTLMVFPLVSRHFQERWPRRISSYLLIVIRTTPEYILAYIFLQLWGPSMLPAILAIGLHNGAIISHLSGQNADLVRLKVDAPRKKVNLYFFEILPRVYGQFLAFLFYRWEVMMRESAILGILGLYTLGFYIDSAMSDDKMDKAILLIVITAMLNMGIDSTSQIVRRRLKISSKLATSS
ncbi:MAG: ABC transporter permease [SAR324 cluster bacterium]|nr:ABC transporter permease [SAR324 cluster bacterium]